METYISRMGNVSHFFLNLGGVSTFRNVPATIHSMGVGNVIVWMLEMPPFYITFYPDCPFPIFLTATALRLRRQDGRATMRVVSQWQGSNTHGINAIIFSRKILPTNGINANIFFKETSIQTNGISISISWGNIPTLGVYIIHITSYHTHTHTY